MTFGTMLLRSILFVIGSLLSLVGIITLLSFPETRFAEIHRRDQLRDAWRTVERNRAQFGEIPTAVPVTAVSGKGHTWPAEIWVFQWRPVNWRSPRDFTGGTRVLPTDKDYLLGFSNPSSDWIDILDSKTGRTSLDETGLHYYLLPPIALLLIASFLFYLARCLRRQDQL